MLGRDINQIFLYELLKNFALSLIGVFIPIYILSQGLPIYHAALFIVVSGFTGVLLSYPISRVVSAKGFKHGLVASYFFMVPGLILIRSFELTIPVIIASSLAYNIGRVTHNICLNSEFAVDSEKDTRGSDSGKMLSLPSISRVIAPFLGGIVFASMGFDALLLIALVFLFTSIIPLLASEDHRDPMEYSFIDIFEREHLRSVPLFLIRGIQAVTAVSVFGLFIYTQVGGALEVGWARALDSLGFVVTGLFTGKIIEKYGDRVAVLTGTLGAAAVHLSRSLVALPSQAFAVSFVGGIFFQIYHVPVYRKFADTAEDEDILEYYALRKIFVSLGNILTVATLITGYVLFNPWTGFAMTFLLAAASTLAMNLFTRKIQ
ncbi:MAG: MFS transporter [Candidatus Nanosalina sp.]